MTREEARYYLQSSGFSEEQIATIEQAFKQEQKTGHWEDESPISWICSECGYQVRRYNNTDFCPHCRAKMVELQESEKV